eukprot:12897258-Prorocentrum_lima.AAC.1
MQRDRAQEETLSLIFCGWGLWHNRKPVLCARELPRKLRGKSLEIIIRASVMWGLPTMVPTGQSMARLG